MEEFADQGFAEGQETSGVDLYIVVEVNFFEAFEGVTKTLEYTIPSTGKTESLAIKIPAGAIDGGKLRHKGYGDCREGGGERGDLVIVTTVLDDQVYRRCEADVVMDWKVDETVAREGGEIEVPAPDGSSVTVVVPAGSPNGMKLRVAGRGAPDLRNGGEPGDLVVILRYANVDRGVQAFVTNNTLPSDFEGFIQYVEYDLDFTIETLIYNHGAPEEWTAPKWCREDDIVFFMFATRAKKNLSRVRNQWRKQYRDTFDEEDKNAVEETLDYLGGLCKELCGKIFAVGRVTGTPFFQRREENDWDTHWNSTIYAPISNIWQFDRPVDISEFREFLTISRVGTITPVMGSAFRQLKELIMEHNEVPEYFADSVATPTPLMSINDANWVEVNNLYRHSYFLEHQFRVYYVDYFLRLLGDTKTFWSESVCVSDLSDNSRVDNVIKFYGRYLPVEVKLNVLGERDLPGQCRKYCRLRTIELRRPTGGNACYTDHVLVIDTSALYLYSYETHTVDLIKSLDDIRKPSDVLAFREELLDLLLVEKSATRQRG